MATKQTGLGAPDIAGADDLFEVRKEPMTGQPPQPEQPKPLKSKQTQKGNGKKPETRIKTSLALSGQTIDLLDKLKSKAKKQEGQFVSYGELIDRAVKDLAAKMRVSREE